MDRDIFDTGKAAINNAIAFELDKLQANLAAHYEQQLKRRLPEDRLGDNRVVQAKSKVLVAAKAATSQNTRRALPAAPWKIDGADQCLPVSASLQGDLDICNDSSAASPQSAKATSKLQKSPVKIGPFQDQLEVVIDETTWAEGLHADDDATSFTVSEVDEGDYTVRELWAHLTRSLLERKSQNKHVILELRSTWVTNASADDKIRQVGGVHTMLKKAMTRHDNLPRGRSKLNGSNRGSMTVPRMSMGTEQFRELHAGESVTDKSLLQGFVYHPDQKVALTRMIVATILIMYDIVLFPLAAFDIKDNENLDVMSWVTCLFWSIDIPLSFLQGFYRRGAVEMRPKKIAISYMKGWFIPDLSLVSIDWVLLVFGLVLGYNDKSASAAAGEEAGAIRMMRSFRSTRIFRVVRSLRFLRVFGVVAEIFEALMSETLIIIARLALLILAMLMICHYIACGWYGLANWRLGKEETWIEQYNLADEDLFTQYITSMHWSLTQFTPATNNLAPVSSFERLFAVCTVIFALVMFSNFVSSITNATMQIRKINYERYVEESNIRQFLSCKGVPLNISNRIWHFYKRHYRVRRSMNYEADIHFFSMVPTSLGAALHKHVYLPTLQSHWIFKQGTRIDEESFLSVCKMAISEKYVLHGGEIFNPGDQGTCMIFAKSGSLLYDCALYADIHCIESPAWVAEAALWAKWVHCGQLTVAESSEMLLLDGWQFECVMHQRASDPILRRCLRTYAALFAQFVSDCAEDNKPVTDILGDNYYDKQAELKSMVHRAFHSNQEQQMKIIEKVQENQSAHMIKRLFGTQAMTANGSTPAGTDSRRTALSKMTLRTPHF